METFLPAVALVALTKKVIDFLAMIRVGDWRAVATQVCVWAGAVGVLFLAAQTDWAGAIQLGDSTLDGLNGWSLVFAGMALGSTASVVHDTTKAIDDKQSAALPKLLP